MFSYILIRDASAAAAIIPHCSSLIVDDRFDLTMESSGLKGPLETKSCRQETHGLCNNRKLLVHAKC